MTESNQKGFTTFEILISITIFTTVILLAGSMYLISQKSYYIGSLQAELSQNARVSIDRMSREIRQSVDIITSLPTDAGSAVNEIFFRNGHDISQITYIRYYQDNSDLMREHKYYYFDSDPGTYVAWDSVDGFGDPPDDYIIEDRIVGEYFNDLGFWGNGGLVHISLELVKDRSILNINTASYSRNY